MIWRSISRVAETSRQKPFSDVPSTDPDFKEITYALARGLLDDESSFRPSAPLSPATALLWIFRMQSIEPVDHDSRTVKTVLADPPDVVPLARRFGIDFDTEATQMTRDELIEYIRVISTKLQTEEHEVSLYSEKFHGKGTAFGETFNMYDLTAAHRTFPYNTLVKVMNVQNGKSVTVRINDRGPFVNGRDMDLSLASFTTIADRSVGKFQARFERLGDINLVRRCHDDRFQRRITKDVVLSPGIPHMFALGKTLSLSSDESFVVRNMWYPDGTDTGIQTWVTKGESFEMTPSVIGQYRFLMGTKTGRQREMRMEVVECGEGVL